MQFIINLLLSIRTGLAVVGEGLFNLLRLLALAGRAVFTGKGGIKTRLAGVFTAPAGQRAVFSVLRAFMPNLLLRRAFVTAYPNVATAVVSRFDDVHEVLDREADFEVVYGPKMRQITAGENFFLGMQDSARYTRDVSNMRLAARRDDVSKLIKPFVAEQAAAVIDGALGELDVPQQLTLPIPARLVGHYFGTPGPSEQTLIDWTTIMFWYLFIDLKDDPEVVAGAERAAHECRDYLDQAIAARKRAPTPTDDVLNRCLAMQAAGLPGMDDLDIRNNLIGLIIGAIPTLSRAAVQALDQLLERPDALAQAQQAAGADDDAALARCLNEALRFNPLNPVIYRRAVRDTEIARSSLRCRPIPKDTLVFAANLSAMFDRRQVRSPGEFRTDRPRSHYILWGYGLHTCFGAHINQAVIPAMLKPLLKQSKLRRAEGAAGRIDTGGTPFPQHLRVSFDAK